MILRTEGLCCKRRRDVAAVSSHVDDAGIRENPEERVCPPSILGCGVYPSARCAGLAIPEDLVSQPSGCPPWVGAGFITVALGSHPKAWLVYGQVEAAYQPAWPLAAKPGAFQILDEALQAIRARREKAAAAAKARR